MVESKYIYNPYTSDEMNSLYAKIDEVGIFSRLIASVLNINTRIMSFWRRLFGINIKSLTTIGDKISDTSRYIFSKEIQTITQRHIIVEQNILKFLCTAYSIDYSSVTYYPKQTFSTHERYFDGMIDLLIKNKDKVRVTKKSMKNAFKCITKINNSELEIVNGIPLIRSVVVADALFNNLAALTFDRDLLEYFRSANEQHIYIQKLLEDLFKDDQKISNIIAKYHFEQIIFKTDDAILKDEKKHNAFFEVMYYYLLNKKKEYDDDEISCI